MLDGWGYFESGHIGNKDLLTPTIDEFAKQGMRSTNALAGAPVCGAARAAPLTGLQSLHPSPRRLAADHLPDLALPTFSGDVDPAHRQRAATHRLETLTFPHQLPALPAGSEIALLLFGRHPHHAEGSSLVAGVDLAGEVLLSSHEAQQPIKVHLLNRLRRGPIELQGGVVPLRVGVDAELDRVLGLGSSCSAFSHHGCPGGSFHPRLTTHVI